MAMASIDNLAPTKSLMDLTDRQEGDFGLEEYDLTFLFDDILLIERVKLFSLDRMLNTLKKEILYYFLITWALLSSELPLPTKLK